MLLRNNWYVAAWSAELSPRTVLARRVCGQALALFRAESGAVAALEDRCIHRGMPLSQGGECEGEIVRCPYHGLEFDMRGVCTKIPGQDQIPTGAKVISFPIVERDAMLWVWVGDADKADTAQIPSYPYHTDSDWVWTRDTLKVNANWQLLSDNLLDLSHLQYVHRKTIGGNPQEDAQAKLSAVRDGDRVLVSRWLLDLPAPPFHKAMCGFAGNIDRWQEIEFRPGFIQFYSGATDANTGAYEGRRDGGMHLRHLHCITPETEERTCYLFSVAHNFRLDDTVLTQRMHQLAVATFKEDQSLLEVQQRRRAEDPLRALLDTRNDIATIHARHIVTELAVAEDNGLEVSRLF
jgi:phenylpropionate dioxygenase-like ring-hydroxylating dioxygenase large terminal subunit